MTGGILIVFSWDPTGCRTLDFVVDLIIVIYQILHNQGPLVKDKIHFDSLTRLLEV